MLDRSARLQQLDLEALFGSQQLPAMVTAVGELRHLLKVKVEDSNDLLMAERTLHELGLFFRRLSDVAAQRQCGEYELFISLQ